MTVDTYNDHPGEPVPPLKLPPAQLAHTSEDINIVDLFIILAKRKRLIFGLPFIVALVAVGVSLILPVFYSANVRLLPPQQPQSGAAALLGQLGGAGGLASGLAGVKNPGDLYLAMLRSRRVADKLISRFDLKKKYQTSSQETARLRLADSTTAVSGKDGIITIAVEDRDQNWVAGMANAYAEELQLLTSTLAITEAAQRRVFFERQLEKAKNDLAKVEMSLKGAMDSGGVISVDSESRAILGTAAMLKAQISAKEIQLGSMRAFVTSQNQDYRRATEELSSLRSELAKLEGGRAGGPRVGTVRQGGLDNIQLMRDLKYYQMLYELLAKQYEVARLDEAKEPSLIQVLDPAIQPERKSKPRRAFIVLGAAIMALFAAISWAFISSAKQRAMNVPQEAERWNELKSNLRFK